jgi:hypothetical protein
MVWYHGTCYPTQNNMLASALRRATCSVVVLGRSPAPALLAAPSLVRRYHENVVDHYESPRNVGT